jgi:hypothetical protein
MLEQHQKQVLDDVIAARALIENPDSWTRGAYARDLQGKALATTDPIACKFCAAGALYRATEYDPMGWTSKTRLRVDQAHYEVEKDLPHQGIIGFNDDHDHHEVLAAFDKTIARLRAA